MVDSEEIKVTVDFPFRGRFYWDAEAQTVLEADSAFQQWDESLRSVVPEWLKISELARGIVDEVDKVWEIISEPFPLSPSNELYLTDDQKLTLLDALMLPGTRGVQGEVAWEDGSPGFAVDPDLTGEYVFPWGTSNNEIIAAIYDETQRDIFSMVIEGKRQLIFRADEMADEVYFNSRDELYPVVEKKNPVDLASAVVEEAPVLEKIIRIIPEEQMVTVRVLFPYHALFRWDDDAAKRMGVPTWKLGMYNALKIALNESPHFRKNQVVPDFTTLWSLLNAFRFCVDEEVYKLSQQEKDTVVNALTVPGSRGVYGNIGYEDVAKTKFIVDHHFTREFTLNYRPDGNYVPVLLQFIGNVPFRFEIVG